MNERPAGLDNLLTHVADNIAAVDLTARERHAVALATVLAEVRAERGRQDARWGEQNHPDATGSSYYAHCAKVARRNCQAAALEGATGWDLILLEEVYEALAEGDAAKLRAELLQVAAVAVAWVEAIDRRPR